MATKKATRKARATVDPNETPEQKFVRLANKRMVKLLNDLKLIGNLGRYAHTAEQASAIFTAIAKYTEMAAAQYEKQAAKEAPSFKL